MSNQMMFKSLHIHRQTYAGDRIEASIEFEGIYGAVKLKLDEEFAQRVLEVCADAIVRSAQDAAASLTAHVLEHGTVAALTDETSDGD